MWSAIAQFVVSFLLKEATELWKDGTIKSMASNAIDYAGARFSDNDSKARVARNHLIGEAKNAGTHISKHAANQIIEKAVQRFNKS